MDDTFFTFLLAAQHQKTRRAVVVGVSNLTVNDVLAQS
jgi:hypothetical protein